MDDVARVPGSGPIFLVVFNRVVGVSSGTSDDLVLQDYSI